MTPRFEGCLKSMKLFDTVGILLEIYTQQDRSETTTDDAPKQNHFGLHAR
jgi:hypothetical protein